MAESNRPKVKNRPLLGTGLAERAAKALEKRMSKIDRMVDTSVKGNKKKKDKK